MPPAIAAALVATLLAQTDVPPAASRLEPEVVVEPGTVEPERPVWVRTAPLSTERRIGRVMGSTGLGLLIGLGGSAGFALAPFGMSRVWCGGSSFCGDTALASGIIGASALLPLLVSVVPMLLYPGSSGLDFARSMGGTFIGLAATGTLTGLLALASVGSFNSSGSAGLTIAFLVLAAIGLHFPSLGGTLGFELTRDDSEYLPPRSRAWNIASSAMMSTAVGYLGGGLGAATLFGLWSAACDGAGCQADAGASALIGAFASPLFFALGPLLSHDVRSASGFFLALGGAAATTASTMLVWAALDLGNPPSSRDAGVIVLTTLVKVFTALLPGVASGFLYESSVWSESDWEGPKRSTGRLELMPTFSFDGKRGSIGVVVALP